MEAATSKVSTAAQVSRYRHLIATQVCLPISQMREMRAAEREERALRAYCAAVENAKSQGMLFQYPGDASLTLQSTCKQQGGRPIDGASIWRLFKDARKEIEHILRPAFEKVLAESGKSDEDAYAAARLEAYKLTKAGEDATILAETNTFYPKSWLAFKRFKDEPMMKAAASMAGAEDGRQSRAQQRKLMLTERAQESINKHKRSAEAQAVKLELKKKRVAAQEKFASAFILKTAQEERAARISELKLLMELGDTNAKDELIRLLQTAPKLAQPDADDPSLQLPI
eukprot:scaffold1981_cov345-Pinguiococcus_pyrenoidosus.AAC.11